MNKRLPVRFAFFVALTVLVSVSLFAQDVPLRNWTVPSSPQSSGVRGLIPTTNTEISNGAIFIALAPCRLVDTRNAAGAYGGPPFSAGLTRNFSVSAATTCTGIPSAAAYSMNFTLVNYDASLGQAGFVTAFPTGGTRPNVSTVNFGNGTNAVANAAVVPVSGGSFSVFSSGVTNLIIDINGYFMDNKGLPTNDVFYVIGNITSSLGLFFVNNLDNTGLTTAVQGYLQSNTQNGSAAVKGNASAATGATFGVQGVTGSTTAGAAGVYGSDGVSSTGANNQSAGVIGTSRNHIGVEGISDNVGVRGELFNGAGGLVALGILGLTGGTPYGVWATGNYGGSGAKYFVEPDPEDASQVIRYIALEGAEAGTYFRGRSRFHNGVATITVPKDFRLVTDGEGITVQVTPIGEMATVAVMKLDLDTIVVKASRDVDFFYMVNGVRRSHRDVPVGIGPGREYAPESATAAMPSTYTPVQRQMLIDNGTYNDDGTVNLSTALRLGWDKMWAERERKTPKN